LIAVMVLGEKPSTAQKIGLSLIIRRSIHCRLARHDVEYLTKYG